MEFYLPEFWTVVKGPHKEDVHPTLQYSLTTSAWAKKIKTHMQFASQKNKMPIYIIRKNYRNFSLPECSRRFAGNCGGQKLWGKLTQSVTLKTKVQGDTLSPVWIEYISSSSVTATDLFCFYLNLRHDKTHYEYT